MLVLRRKLNQSILIGDDIRIVVVGLDRATVKLAIQAPPGVAVNRAELLERLPEESGPTAGDPSVP